MTMVMEALMKSVSKSELKAKMLEYFRKVEETGEELIVTSNRVPVLKVTPIRKNKSVDDVFAPYRGKMTVTGNLLDDTSSEWNEF